MDDPIKLADEIDEVMQKSGKSDMQRFVAAELVYLKYKAIVEKIPPKVYTPEEEAEINADVAEMMAIADANQAKVDEAVNHLMPVIMAGLNQFSLSNSLKTLAISDILERFEKQVDSDFRTLETIKEA